MSVEVLYRSGPFDAVLIDKADPVAGAQRLAAEALGWGVG